MTRAKKILVIAAVATAAAIGAAAPALADGHTPVPPIDDQISATPLGDGHTPTPPQD
ncbi:MULTISPECIES: hypothetical protein [Streptomyces]